MIKAILFDYGATLDTGGTHWYHIFAHQHLMFHTTVPDVTLRDAYVFAERSVSANHSIAEANDFLTTLRTKVTLQCHYLVEHDVYPAGEEHIEEIAQACYATAQENTRKAGSVLNKLQEGGYKMGLVSNFYGNLNAVLTDFKLRPYFSDIIESAKVHISKPDPRLWQMGLDHLHTNACDTLVVGDSYPKDIVPAHDLGCHTVWLKGRGWNRAPRQTPAADHVITSLAAIPDILSNETLYNR
jgi:putative hydrolase of the HAD superfamily